MDLIKFRVTGTVQGVCFRYYTQREAQTLGIRGWCHNHPDASVEGAAAGPPDAIAKFKLFLRRGPPAAKVADLHVEETKDASPDAVAAALGDKDGFHVRKYRRP
ncbi:Acylphosphatase [Cutaneotrichosporon oleaginosum]|uniref:acylphosphatase n=1 Tax=Cutaneotrichosporon oleaginosum TaxID=879819 RepID=A0A0J1B2Z1_9TREE|nr:Acylphosphatase [Cutaneotrichosporon oleaginosum]KLT41974.1 Acylphosphatase [Cutaneotrichosporon oleaginosum]